MAAAAESQTPWEDLFDSLAIASAPLQTITRDLIKQEPLDEDQQQPHPFSPFHDTPSSSFSATPTQRTALGPTNSISSGLTQLHLAATSNKASASALAAAAAANAAASAEKYNTVHAEALARLGLSPNNPSSWTTDLLLVISRIKPIGRRSRWMSCLFTILSGRVSIEDTSDGVVKALRDTVGGIKREDEDTDLAEFLFAVLVVLDLRFMEAECEGILLDPLARSLRYTLRAMLESRLTPLRDPDEQTRQPLQPVTASSSTSTTSTRTRSPTKPSLPVISTPTEEQYLIAASPITPGLTLVKAFAGTGKTSSLVLFASRLQQTSPTLKALYCCFNQKIRIDAGRKLMQFGVEAKTTGTLAFAHLASKWKDNFLAKSRLGWRADVVVRLLGIRDQTYEIPESGKKGRLKAKAIALRVMKSLLIFSGSNSKDLFSSHLVKQKAATPNIPQNELYEWTRKLWALVSDFENLEAPAPTACHVKLCLVDPSFNLSQYQVILYDEVQDSSDADLEFIVRQLPHSRVILVGDEHQAIYRWRGGFNTWIKLSKKADTILRLSQSFRFGSQIANVANVVLASKGESEAIKGNSKDAKVYRPLRKGENLPVGDFPGGKWTVLFRTNKGLVDSLFQLSQGLFNGINLHRPLNISLKVAGQSNTSTTTSSLLSIYYHAYDLLHQTPDPHTSQLLIRSPKYEHRFHPLVEFGSWEDLKEHVRELGEDLEEDQRALADIVGMESDLKDEGFREKLDRAGGCVVEDEEADVILGVTHQVKGLEWTNVALGDDFVDCFERRSLSFGGFLSEEFNLLYVALTRAKEQLVLSAPLFRLSLLQRGLHNFYLDQTSSAACMICFSQARPFIQYHTPFASVSTPPSSPFSLSPSPHPSTPPDIDPFSTQPLTPPSSQKRSRDEDQSTPTPKARGKRPATINGGEPTPEDVEVNTSMFPCCLSCATKSSYVPLRDFGELWEGIKGVLQESGRVDLTKCKEWIEGLKKLRPKVTGKEGKVEVIGRFDAFVGTAKERSEKIGEGLVKEIGLREFWTKLGEERDEEMDFVRTSPSKKRKF